MIKIGPNYDKLKTLLRLASHRLKILQTKKLEICEKLKIEAADNIKRGKFMQARIKAHRIAREDATVEAMELTEMYCDLILERYELFQGKRAPDDSLLILVASLIWVAPYFQSYVEELKEISKQMTVKYGSRFCRQALTNNCGIVRKELIERVKQFMPSDEKIENCLRKICSKYEIEYSKRVEDNLKDLSNVSFKQGSTISRIALTSENGDVEYVAAGSSKTEDPVSSKKAFMNIMNKLKSENTGGLSNDGSKFYHTKISSGANFPNQPIENLDGVKVKNEREGKGLKCKGVSENENGSDSQTGIFNEMTTEKCVLSFNNSDIRSDAIRNMYFDPPPPYNYQYLAENKTEKRFKDEDTLDKDFQNLQLPSCPDDDPN